MKKAAAETQRALSTFLESLGVPVVGDLKRSPGRAAALWQNVLLKGQGVDAGETLGRGMASTSKALVCLDNVNVHLVCPHHLTVAFGTAAVAYIPDGRIVSFGALGKLIDVCTSRLVLQEEAVQDIADAIVQHLGARAAAAYISAAHPCHNLTQSKAHHSTVSTLACAGDATLHERLERRVVRVSTKATKKGSGS